MPERIFRGEADPDLVARFALASRVLSKCAPEKFLRSESSVGQASEERVLRILRSAEIRFLYLWERCHVDVESTKRASLLALLASFLMVAYGAFPAYYSCFNNSKLPGSLCMFLTVEQLVSTLAFGLSLCVMLFLVSGSFERTLANRRARWMYFCAQLKNELSAQ